MRTSFSFFWQRRRRRFVVAGESMKPWLAADDHVLVDPKAKLRVGDVVVAKHPFRSDLHLVKQIVRFDEAGCAQLAGINPQASTDSRTLGMFAPALVLGRVTSRF